MSKYQQWVLGELRLRSQEAMAYTNKAFEVFCSLADNPYNDEFVAAWHLSKSRLNISVIASQAQARYELTMKGGM